MAYTIEGGLFMQLYNTLTKQIEPFIPNEEGKVKMYTCGPTVYNYAHIGNLRSYIFEDVLVKTLTYLGYDVTRVMNITDVGHLTSDGDTGEDKMSKGALREGKTVQEIAEFYTKAFLKDLEKLNIQMPDILEKASDHIDIYIQMIEKLLQDGYAYQKDGNVYFDISKVDNYYQLSGKKKEELQVAVREDVEEDMHKKNPFDFGLWFTTSKFQNQIMKWDSPWGVGYPGWHIECSGLACHYLGDHLDIHCGGVDNIFPHHSNEIAQSEAYLGHKWCNYWMHGEYLNDKSGKMSKSKGGILTLSVLEENGYNPLSYRYFCLNSHYRKPLVFSYESLEGAEKAYLKLKKKTTVLKKEGSIDDAIVSEYDQKFKDAISQDLNLASAITLVYDVLKEKQVNDATKRKLIAMFDQVLSLSLLEEEAVELDQDYILEMIQKRQLAKQNKNYEEADRIREQLLKEGIRLIDGREKTTYESIKEREK